MSHIYESPTPPPRLPRCSVYDYLYPLPRKGSQQAHYPAPPADGVAFIDGLTGRKVTRGQVGEEAKYVASGLRGLGVKKGEVACIHALNSLEWVNAWLGCQAGGYIVSPANPGYTPDELLHQLTDSTASVVFVAPVLLPNLLKALALPGAPSIPDNRIILLCPSDAKSSEGKQYKAIGEIWRRETQFKPVILPEGNEADTAYLCYSSGTTGKAKGVETSHHNITSQVQALNLVYEPLHAGKDVILAILPFGHIYGLTVTLHQPLTRGVPVVVLPRFEEPTVLKAIQDYKVTWALFVPPILIVLLHSKIIQNYDISAFRGIMSGAAPLGADLIDAFGAKYPKIKLTQGYGLTETSPVTHVMTTAEAQGHAGQVGKLMPTFQARIVDPETGRDVKKGERGEMWFRGPSVMKGYWRNTEATKNTFAEGGWFKTGDIAVVDKNGYFAVVDRFKELIKYKGFQVPPAELEAVLLRHPKVADAAVIGIYSSAQATELPRAYIAPVGGLSSLSDDERKKLSAEIAKWVEDKVANYRRLRGGVVLIEAVPKSPSGKILRKDLRVLAKKESEEEVKKGRVAKL